MEQVKPKKKLDKELWGAIESLISTNDYVVSIHARKRQKDRNISDLDILDILENKSGRKRKRNKSKDTYSAGRKDWNYCIEGDDLDGLKIRIIVSFDDACMLVITVIRIDDGG